MSAPSEAVALDYELTEGELASFIGETLARVRLYKWLWPQRRYLLGLLFLVDVLVAMAVFSSRSWWGEAQTRLLISAAFGLFVLLIFIFDPLFSSLLIRRRARSGKYQVHLQRIRLEVDSTTLKATILRSGESCEWRGIRDIKLSRLGAIVWVAPAHGFMIPKRPFGSEADFMAFMQKVNRLPRVAAAKP